MPVCSWKSVGDERANRLDAPEALASGPCGSRRSWVVGIGSDALAISVRDYVIEHLAENDAVLVTTRPAFSKGQSSCGVARQYTGSAGKITTADRRFATYFRATVMRSSIVRCISEGMDRRSDRLEAAYVPPMPALRQTKACNENDRTRDSRVCTVQMVEVIPLRCWRHRTATTSGSKGLSRGRSAHVFHPGASDRRSPVRPQRSPDAALIRLERCRLEPEPKDHGHDWFISNWPSQAEQFNVLMMVCGRAVC